MKTSKFITKKIIALIIGVTGITCQTYGQPVHPTMPHEMQHGFVLAADDKFASHLVAPGHHSRQTEITGQLLIDDKQAMEIYQERKSQSHRTSYFLFQAQSLDLPNLSAGQLLTGHIVESKLGDYEPKNKIVKSATFLVQKVLLNIANPFFTEEAQRDSTSQTKELLQQESSNSTDLINPIKNENPHCCDTGAKPCNWKC